MKLIADINIDFNHCFKSVILFHSNSSASFMVKERDKQTQLFDYTFPKKTV